MTKILVKYNAKRKQPNAQQLFGTIGVLGLI
jgi:hypothetical protein